jgi:hypothetical protein
VVDLVELVITQVMGQYKMVVLVDQVVVEQKLVDRQDQPLHLIREMLVELDQELLDLLKTPAVAAEVLVLLGLMLQVMLMEEQVVLANNFLQYSKILLLRHHLELPDLQAPTGLLVVVEEEQQLLDQLVEQEEQEELVAAVLVELNLVHLEVVMD